MIMRGLNMKGGFTSMGGEQHSFPKTIWKVIVDAQDRNSEEYRKKLNHLVSLYWKPVYIYIRTQWSKSNEDAKELTQDFFTLFMEKDYLENFTPQKGRFRSYVKTALKNFLIDVKRKGSALKRGGDTYFTSINIKGADQFDPDSTSDPAQRFDREWAKEVLKRSVDKMKENLERDGKAKYFRSFEMHHEEDKNLKKTRKQIAEELGTSEANIKYYLTYTKNLLAEIIKDEVKEYVLDRSEVEDEVQFLLSTLQKN